MPASVFLDSKNHADAIGLNTGGGNQGAPHRNCLLGFGCRAQNPNQSANAIPESLRNFPPSPTTHFVNASARPARTISQRYTLSAAARRVRGRRGARNTRRVAEVGWPYGSGRPGRRVGGPFRLP